MKKSTQNFMLISNPLKKCLKNTPKKVISKTSLTGVNAYFMPAYFCHAFANNFFGHLFKSFSTDLKSA
jgi:hypothetical protein